MPCRRPSYQGADIFWELDEMVGESFIQAGKLIEAANRLRDSELSTEASRKSPTPILEVDREVMQCLAAMMGAIEGKVNETKKYIEIMSQLSRRSEDIFKGDKLAVKI